MKRVVFALALASASFSAAAAPQPSNVYVTNPVIPVEVSNADPIPVTTQQTTSYEVLARFDDLTGGHCLNSGCVNFSMSGGGIMFDLPVVPAGERWIITNLSGRIPVPDQHSFVVLQSASFAAPDYAKAILYGPLFELYPNLSNNGAFGFNGQVYTSYGPGETPHVLISTTSAFTSGAGFVLVNGYLVNSP